MLQLILDQHGHHVSLAGDGKAALAEISQRRFDLVVTDILMPGTDGLELIAALRKQHPQMRILAISGGGRSGTMGYLETARALGADAVQSKPFTPAELMTSIDKAVSLNPPIRAKV